MGSPPERASITRPVVLWERGSISCTCLIVAPDHLEVTVAVDDVVVSTDVFTDHNAAAEFAIDQMHAFNAT